MSLRRLLMCTAYLLQADSNYSPYKEEQQSLKGLLNTALNSLAVSFLVCDCVIHTHDFSTCAVA